MLCSHLRSVELKNCVQCFVILFVMVCKQKLSCSYFGLWFRVELFLVLCVCFHASSNLERKHFTFIYCLIKVMKLPAQWMVYLSLYETSRRNPVLETSVTHIDTVASKTKAVSLPLWVVFTHVMRKLCLVLFATVLLPFPPRAVTLCSVLCFYLRFQFS